VGSSSTLKDIQVSNDKCNKKKCDKSAPWFGRAKKGVYHTMALPFTLQSTLRQKKNYENSNISP
jgi:hypothetical protein